MSLIVPTSYKTTILQTILNQSCKLRLFSNNIIPAVGDTFASYTQVTGGGYAEKSLAFGSWTISAGLASYPAQDFNFSGATDAPGTVYGYYVVIGTTLMWAERFDATVLPFSPILNSLVRVQPKLQIS